MIEFGHLLWWNVALEGVIGIGRGCLAGYIRWFWRFYFVLFHFGILVNIPLKQGNRCIHQLHI